MQSYNAHSLYFEELCRKIKVFSHERPDMNTGDTRKTFFRMNNLEEILAGQVQGIHFPCLVHESYDVRGVDKGGSERLFITQGFYVLVKPTDKSADAIAAAYTEAEAALQKIVSYMINEYEENGSCGPFRYIDITMFNWQAIAGAELDNLYGFTLDIRAEHKPESLTTYDPNDYY